MSIRSALIPGELWIVVEVRPLRRLEAGLLEQLAARPPRAGPRPAGRAARPAAPTSRMPGGVAVLPQHQRPLVVVDGEDDHRARVLDDEPAEPLAPAGRADLVHPDAERRTSPR